MNGIRLKSEKIPPLKLEKIKWITILILTHIFSWLLVSTPVTVISKTLPNLREGHIRLQIQLHSQVPEGQGYQDVLMVTSDHQLISNRGRLLKKIQSVNSLGTVLDEYLVELPEEDLPKLIRSKGKGIEVYPAGQRLGFKRKIHRSKKYEINF